MCTPDGIDDDLFITISMKKIQISLLLIVTAQTSLLYVLHDNCRA